MMDGLLVVDKPAGPTSHDVVMRIRRSTGQRKVGHAGTLDPAATGVMVLLLGRFTRLADVFAEQEKSYRAVVELGTSTTTGDAEGEIVERSEVPLVDDERVESALAALVGTRSQTPPPFSARKVEGTPLYKRARAGEPIPEVEPKTVEVYSARSVERRGLRITADLRVSKGTYVRVLAEDLGRALGVPAHLAALTRTASGPFTLAEAHELAQLEEGGRGAIQAALVDVAAHRLGPRRAKADRSVAAQAVHGGWVAVRQVAWMDTEDDGSEDVLLLDESGLLGWYRQEGPVLKPRAVLRGGGIR